MYRHYNPLQIMSKKSENGGFAINSTVRPTVHTIKSDTKTELFENALQTGGI